MHCPFPQVAPPNGTVTLKHPGEVFSKCLGKESAFQFVAIKIKRENLFFKFFLQDYVNNTYETPKSCGQVGVRTHSLHWDGAHWVSGIDFEVSFSNLYVRALAMSKYVLS